MTSFAWKRKLGQDVCKNTVAKFCSEAKDDEINKEISNDDVLFRKKTTSMALEDSLLKSARLTEEGSRLAENERYWEAIKKWDEAISFTPSNEKLYEMKAQSLLQLNELHPAVQAAEQAVKFRPTWWVAYQTLGRAFLGLGEVKRAVVSFSRAVHINPADQELFQDDLGWACSLLDKFKALQRQSTPADQTAGGNNVVIKELDEDCKGDSKEGEGQLTMEPYDWTRREGAEVPPEESSRLGGNWIRMRVNK